MRYCVALLALLLPVSLSGQDIQIADPAAGVLDRITALQAFKAAGLQEQHALRLEQFLGYVDEFESRADDACTTRIESHRRGLTRSLQRIGYNLATFLYGGLEPSRVKIEAPRFRSRYVDHPEALRCAIMRSLSDNLIKIKTLERQGAVDFALRQRVRDQLTSIRLVNQPLIFGGR